MSYKVGKQLEKIENLLFKWSIPGHLGAKLGHFGENVRHFAQIPGAFGRKSGTLC